MYFFTLYSLHPALSASDEICDGLLPANLCSFTGKEPQSTAFKVTVKWHIRFDRKDKKLYEI